MGLFRFERAPWRSPRGSASCFSGTGPYGPLGRDCRDGADLALAEIAGDPDASVRFEVVHAEPAGDPRTYVEHARAMLRETGCRHIVGTVTSIARKEVIPLVEKHDGLLWYVCPYEGFEANENVVYTRRLPQPAPHPAVRASSAALRAREARLSPRRQLRLGLGEMNRLARDLLMEAGGEVVGERCLPLDETDVARLVTDVEARRPSFVLNNLIGPSSHAFLRAMRALGDRDPAFRPDACPVVSCDLSECELPAIGLGVATGQFSTAAYFDSLDSPENRAFKAKATAVFGAGRRLSTYVEGATPPSTCSPPPPSRRSAATSPPPCATPSHGFPSTRPTGRSGSTRGPNHAALPFLLGRIRDDGGFDVVAQRPAIAADPYLTAAAPGLAGGAPGGVMTALPTLIGWRAIVIHRPDEARTGSSANSGASASSPPCAGNPSTSPARPPTSCWWTPTRIRRAAALGRRRRAAAVVALLQSEAPGRVASRSPAARARSSRSRSSPPRSIPRSSSPPPSTPSAPRPRSAPRCWKNASACAPWSMPR